MDDPWEKIPPNTVPGGLFVRVTAGRRVLAEHRLTNPDTAEQVALRDSELASGYPEARVFIYDGDTGVCIKTIVNRSA